MPETAVAVQPAKRFLNIDPATLAEVAMPLAVLAIVLALITPHARLHARCPLVIDIMMSVTVMMVAMYIRKPGGVQRLPHHAPAADALPPGAEHLPARLILLNGNTGTTAAGDVIQAFGNFVVGGNYIIGTVIFLVLIAIQYVVINHGAVRISEVTARFTLDALPGKQMSIDSDLNSGLIDEAEARNRRKALAREAEFYGAMDGASRFTQRDAVAAILITGINIVAGFLIGVLQHGMDLKQAPLQTYTVLTIGDGLVTVIPALMISISGGLDRHPRQLRRPPGRRFPPSQVFGSPQPLMFWLPACCWCWPPFPACPPFRSCCWAAAWALSPGACGAKPRRQRRRLPSPPPPAPKTSRTP